MRWIRAAMRGAWCVALVSAASPAEAQAPVARSFEQLQVLVGPGARVSVFDGSGRETTGKIVALSDAALTLQVDGKPLDLAEADVTRIVQRRPDSLGNGAKWGFITGAGLGALAAVSIMAEYDDSTGSRGALLGAAILLYGGLGAGVGVGFDALHESRQVIFARPGASAARLVVSPLLSSRRTGVALTVRF